MSHFYGTMKGARGETTRTGTANSGLQTIAAGWKGAIEVYVTRDGNGDDVYSVYLIPWCSSGGEARLIASGKLDSRVVQS